MMKATLKDSQANLKGYSESRHPPEQLETLLVQTLNADLARMAEYRAQLVQHFSGARAVHE